MDYYSENLQKIIYLNQNNIPSDPQYAHLEGPLPQEGPNHIGSVRVIYIYLDLRKDTNNCPFARFVPLGRISCEGAGNCYFLFIVVNFEFRIFWANFTLFCVKMCRFFWAEIPGKKDGNT